MRFLSGFRVRMISQMMVYQREERKAALLSGLTGLSAGNGRDCGLPKENAPAENGCLGDKMRTAYSLPAKLGKGKNPDALFHLDAGLG
jgi:hypothetical protein